jgi:hypothetical protein
VIIKKKIAGTETSMKVTAKTCGCKEKNMQRVTYSFTDSYHGLCIDKKDIISAELEACEQLLKYAADESDKNIVEREIAELRMMLDLMP